MHKILSGQTRKTGLLAYFLLQLLATPLDNERIPSAWPFKVKCSTFRSQLLTASRCADATSAKSVCGSGSQRMRVCESQGPQDEDLVWNQNGCLKYPPLLLSPRLCFLTKSHCTSYWRRLRCLFVTHPSRLQLAIVQAALLSLHFNGCCVFCPHRAV